MVACRVCGSDEAKATWQARERMLGAGEVFVYEECARCGCLQIAEVPADIGRYHATHVGKVDRGLTRSLARYLGECRLAYLASGRGVVGRAASRLRPCRPAPVDPCVPLDTRILAVGSASGDHLAALLGQGYRDLTGVDPHMHPGAERVWPIRLAAKAILQVDPGEGLFGVILFSHSLGQIAEQHEAMEKARELLAPGGVCVVQTANVSSWAWEYYRTDWVQLDAPRCLCLHSRDSLRHLAHTHGFRVERMVYDSSGYQLWGSEQYRKGAPVPVLPAVCPGSGRDPIGGRRLREFEARAAQLNREERGDQFTAWLRADVTT